MHRRDALTGLLALGAAGSLARNAFAQQVASQRKIGYLSLEAAPKPRRTPEQWRQTPLSVALRSFGLDEGGNLVIERALADLNIAQLPKLAAELVRKRVEVIVTSGPEATVAAARATHRIPIVFFNVVWPEEQGLVGSLGRPGGNVTGVSFYAGMEVSTKRMEIIREVVPAARRLSWLWPTGYQETLSGGAFDIEARLIAAAKAVGFDLRLHPIGAIGDLEAAFKAVVAARAQAMMASSEYVRQALARVVEFALSQRLPSAFPGVEYVEAGGLLSYAASREELRMLFLRSAEYVGRILRGERPGELPVERPKRYELAINLKTARALGLSVPKSVLLRADRTIE